MGLRSNSCLVAIVLFCASFPQTSLAQQKDARALEIVSASLSASGGAGTLSKIQDFTANGTIVYYWAGKEVHGSVLVRGRGTSQFRLDAELPEGTQSWIVSNGTGALKKMNGTVTPIPFHNAITFGALTLPSMKLLSAISKESSAILDKGEVTIEDQHFYRIQVRPVIDAHDSRGDVNRLGIADYFFDPATNLIVAIFDKTHPAKTMSVSHQHAVYFGDYRAVGSVVVPFSVIETINGQRMWALTLKAIRFNTGLSDSDFQF